jgi:F-type H+-transporting ATPase subunit c
MKKVSLTALSALGALVFFPVLALAAEEAGGSPDSSRYLMMSVIAIGGGFGITLSAIFGAISQSKAIVAALQGIARNPGAAGKIVTPLIIGLAMIESLVIYSLIISLILVFKI